jgi:hypothetical protein
MGLQWNNDDPKYAEGIKNLPELYCCEQCGRIGGRQEFRAFETSLGDVLACADTEACSRRRWDGEPFSSCLRARPRTAR